VVAREERDRVEVAEAVALSSHAQVQALMRGRRRSGADPLSTPDVIARADRHPGERHRAHAQAPAEDRHHAPARPDAARDLDPSRARRTHRIAGRGREVGAAMLAAGEGVGPDGERARHAARDRRDQEGDGGDEREHAIDTTSRWRRKPLVCAGLSRADAKLSHFAAALLSQAPVASLAGSAP
jgi:hypothetical protein